MSRPAPTSPAAAPNERSTRPLLYVAAIAAVLIVLPIAVAAGAGLFERATRTASSAPNWLVAPPVRATTNDGIGVKARVALDVADEHIRKDIEGRAGQVALLLETTVASHARDEISGSAGIETLAADMRDRLNAYLQTDGVDAVRSVAILDLFYTQP
jgi:flagellar basal body-associated protein FliL